MLLSTPFSKFFAVVQDLNIYRLYMLFFYDLLVFLFVNDLWLLWT